MCRDSNSCYDDYAHAFTHTLFSGTRTRTLTERSRHTGTQRIDRQSTKSQHAAQHTEAAADGTRKSRSRRKVAQVV